MQKYYTGVGSRKTPLEIQIIMSRLAKKLSALGYRLRSGGAQGADSAFERGAGNNADVFHASDATVDAMALAAEFHPAWSRCSEFARRLHGRNSFQVLGRDLNTPSAFLVCWTIDGCTSHAERTIRTGGTGTAISIASDRGVPVFNLARADHLQRISQFVGL